MIQFPKVFYKVDRRQPHKFTFLCDYPYCDGMYAVYLNEQTKLPERIHYSEINFESYDLCFEVILKQAEVTVETIKNRIKHGEKITKYQLTRRELYKL